MTAELQRIHAALKNYLPDGHRITGLCPTSDGYSNRTLLIEGLDLILRTSPLGEPMLAAFGVHDVPTQYHIMQEFAQIDAAPPVPTAVCLELDTGLLGFPFFLMKRVDCDPWGDSSRPDWLNHASPSFRAGVSERFVQNYLDLHALAPIATLGPVRTASQELQNWQGPVQDICGPALAEAFRRLFGDPPEEQPPVPCHGDAKPANLLWKDGDVAAMVDYEMAFNGDPRWDLAALLQGLRSADGQGPLPMDDEAGFWGERHIISQWQAGTGRSVERLDWFRAADRARYAALLVHGQKLFESGRTADARLGALGAIATRLSETALRLARRDSQTR